MNGHIALVSGGLDSAVMLADIRDRFPVASVTALFIRYGQKHAKEEHFAADIAESYGADYQVLDLSPIFLTSLCPLLKHSDKAVSPGAYPASGVAETYVPFRNGVFLSAAASYAYSIGAGTIWYAAHMTDVGSAYPDCSPEFVDAMSNAIVHGTQSAVFIMAPFVRVRFTKTDVVRLGHQLQVDFSKTWSCYAGEDIHCGVCGTCRERKQAFREAEIVDPTLYRE